ncbi:MAG: EamA family transporter [Nocardioidaceae bacterium]
MAVLLALASAGAYGLSDFLGGLFSRRMSVWPVAVVGQSSSTMCAYVLAVALGGSASSTDWWWGTAAGIGGGLGTAFLYRGFATGKMSVVAPISALGSAVVPVAAGLVAGDRPTALAWIGIAFAMPAIYLISRISDGTVDTADDHGGAVVDGVVAGLGFGSMFAMLGQISSDAGLYPLALTQLTSVVAIVLAAAALRQSWIPRRREPWKALVLGPLGTTATAAFLYATHTGLLSIVSVIAALYPALTVVLAASVLRERIHRAQAIGLGLAALAVSLVAAG